MILTRALLLLHLNRWNDARGVLDGRRRAEALRTLQEIGARAKGDRED